MKKILLLVTVCLFLAGCSKTYTQPLNVNQGVLPTANVNQADTASQTMNTADWKNYTSDKLGISFKYPAEFIRVNEDFEVGSGEIALLANVGSYSVFLTAHNPEYKAPEQYKDWARGGYWGDESQFITSQDYIEKFCKAKTDCQILINTNGVKYAKLFEANALIAEDVTQSNIYSYYIYNPNSEYNGIIISNASMKEEFKNIDQVIEGIVQTIKFN